MNTRAVGDKLFVSDSDGRVGCFTGRQVRGEVGKANVEAGCKSSLWTFPRWERVYYIDVITPDCVLDRKPDEKAQAAR